MSDFPRWKYALVVLVLIFGVIYALPNVFKPSPALQIAPNRGQVVDDALKSKVQGILDQNKLAVTDVQVDLVAQRMLMKFPDAESRDKAADAVRPVLGDGYIVALNLASNVPSWLGAIHAAAMPLGLDLQGGVHFLMEVDQSSVQDKLETTYADDIRSLLRDKNIRYESVTRNGRGAGIGIILKSDADRDAASTAIAVDHPDLILANGNSTGDRFVLNATVKPDKLRELAQSTIRQNLTTLRNRVNALGVSEPLIQQQGDSRIVVELAGVQDTAEAKKLLGAVDTLQYREGLAGPGDPRAQDAQRTGNIPPDANLVLGNHGEPYLVSKKIIVTGDELTDAASGFDQQTGTPKVDVVLNSAGARKMTDFSSAHVGKPMAVVYAERVTDTKVVDGKEVRTARTSERVINYATINSTLGKNFQTTGLASPTEASDLALLLKGGALAAPTDIVEEGVIGASLGADNIEKGVKAVLIGLGVVLLAAALYYKLFGLVADVALFFNLILLMAVMSLIGVTLTMPGIAGIVLTLGMAIDANVLICERIREELRNGSTPLASIRAGYEKAWATILDANVTHLLAALGLMTMGSGPIRGFGVTLFIGILTSMFTSVTVTHAITALIHGGRKLKTLSV